MQEILIKNDLNLLKETDNAEFEVPIFKHNSILKVILKRLLVELYLDQD